jgi:hypothetical protein
VSGLKLCDGYLIDPVFDISFKTYKSIVKLDDKYLVVDVLFCNNIKSDGTMMTLADKIVRKFKMTYERVDFYRTMVIIDGKLVPSGRSHYMVAGLARVPSCAKLLSGYKVMYHNDNLIVNSI